MKLGPLEVTWRMRVAQARYDRALVKGVFVALLDEPPGIGDRNNVRERIGKAARSEVKDYLAERADQAGCTHTPATMGDGVTRCYACNPELVIP